MIILGEKYQFTEKEKKILLKKFKTITIIPYKNSLASEVIKKIEKNIKQTNSSLIVLNTQARLQIKVINYLIKLEDIGIKYLTIEDFLEKYLYKHYIPKNQNEKIKNIKNLQGYSLWEYIQKRIIDYIGVLILSIPTVIALLYSKYKISKESPGPLIYKQKRVGKNEKEFCCIKIRSMHLDAEKDGAQFASEGDERVFKWGNFIRKKKIDELPQIWNVLKGEMHLVGPRPERPIWTKEFKKTIPCYSKRHLIAPGITGLAQVKYHYGAGKLDAEQKLMYDLYYIKNWSLKLELEIIYKTIFFIIKNKKNL